MKEILLTILLTVSGWFGYVPEQNIGADPRTLQVTQGGTGAQSFTAGQCLVGNGTSPVTSQVCGTGSGSWATSSSDYWETKQWRWNTSSVAYWETTQPERGGGTGSWATGSEAYYWSANFNDNFTSSANASSTIITQSDLNSASYASSTGMFPKYGTLGELKTSVSNDFHNLGGTDLLGDNWDALTNKPATSTAETNILLHGRMTPLYATSTFVDALTVYNTITLPNSSIAWSKLTQIPTSTTDQLPEGSTNQYFTSARHNWDTLTNKPASSTVQWLDIAGKPTSTTDQLPQGSTNLYWTQARFDTALSASSTVVTENDFSGLMSPLWDTKYNNTSTWAGFTTSFNTAYNATTTCTAFKEQWIAQTNASSTLITEADLASQNFASSTGMWTKAGTLAELQTLVSNDFHNLGGTDLTGGTGVWSTSSQDYYETEKFTPNFTNAYNASSTLLTENDLKAGTNITITGTGDKTISCTASGGGGYAEFTQVGHNQQNASTTPFKFANGLLASTTVVLSGSITIGDEGDTTIGSSGFATQVLNSLSASSTAMFSGQASFFSLIRASLGISASSTSLFANTKTTNATSSHFALDTVTGSQQCAEFGSDGSLHGSGSACGTGSGGGAAWEFAFGGAIKPTSTNGIFVGNASSTVSGLRMNNGGFIANNISTTTATTTIANGLKVYKVENTTTLEFL